MTAVIAAATAITARYSVLHSRLLEDWMMLFFKGSDGPHHRAAGHVSSDFGGAAQIEETHFGIGHIARTMALLQLAVCSSGPVRRIHRAASSPDKGIRQP